MASGIYAEIEIGDPGTCQVAPFADGKREVTQVTRTQEPSSDGDVIEEFTLTTGIGEPRDVDPVSDPESDPEPTGDDAAVPTKVFEYDDRSVYRLRRAGPQGCACERIESARCLVRDVTVTDGRLIVCFLAPTIERLREVLGRLNDAYRDVCVRRLLRSGESEDSEELVLLDRRELTERQEEVLQAAHERGYFEHPRAASATEVAASLDISVPTFTEHLAAAQRKLLDGLLAGEA